MYKAGLAYQSNMPINWCPVDKTGLANEEVVNGGCERCGAPVEQKKIRTMGFTNYRTMQKNYLMALIRLNGQKKLKLMQRNWIGKSEGAEILFQATTLDGKTLSITSFYHKLQKHCYGVTFLVIAPDHALLPQLVTVDKKNEIIATFVRA